jgi:hypothetical protein
VRLRQRDHDTECRSLAGCALDANAASHTLDDQARDRKPQPGAQECARRAAVGLLELVKDSLLLIGRNANAGVAHRDDDRIGLGAALDHDRNPALVGELDGVAGEIEQHLAQACGVAHDLPRQVVGDIGGHRQVLRLRARRDQLHGLLDQDSEIERPRLEVEPAGLDLGEIENLLDQCEQRFARGFHRTRVGQLLGCQRGVAQEIGHAEDAVKWRPDLVRHHRQEARFGTACGFRLVARAGERALGLRTIGDVAADALHFGTLTGADRHLAPSDPALAFGSRNFLVVAARAIGSDRGCALLNHLRLIACADERVARAAGERAERVVGVSDAALAVAAHDHVALGCQERACALLCFLELPVAVVERLGALLQRLKLATKLAVACKQEHSKADAAARKCGEPNGERMQIEWHGRPVPRASSGRRSGDSGAMVRWKGCDSLPDGRRAIVRVDGGIMPRLGRARDCSALGPHSFGRNPSAQQDRSAPLGFPIAAALAGRRFAPPGSATTATGEAAGPNRALLTALDGSGHAAARIHRAGQLDAGCAVVDDAPVIDRDAVAVGAVALAGLGDDQNGPQPVEACLRLRGSRRHAEESGRDDQEEVRAYQQHTSSHWGPLTGRRRVR